MSRIDNDGNLHVTGHFSCGSMTIPSGSVSDASFSSVTGSRLTTAKAVHRHKFVFADAATAEPTAETVIAFMATAAGKLKLMKVKHTQAPTGTGETTVDLKKNGTSVLSGATPVTLNLATGTNVQTGNITTIDYVAGDVVSFTKTASAGDGAKGQGLIIVIEVDEDPA